MKFRVCIVILFTLSMPRFGLAQSEKLPRESWVDYVAGDYDMWPNITYATANSTPLKLDLYAPKDRPNAVPLVIYFHGGGWVAGQKERDVLDLLPYFSLGWAVANVEYRLANNSPAPAAVEDCRCALHWLAARAKQFGFDTLKIILTGGSAGGHLALITGMLPPNSVFDHQCPTGENIRWSSGSEPQVRVAAIVNWFGISDVAELLEGPNARHYAVEWFGSVVNRKELAEELSPLTYVRPGLPAIITIHGDSDNIVPYEQATRLHAALDSVGVPNELVTIRGGKHDGFNRREIAESFDRIRAFLRNCGVFMKE